MAIARASSSDTPAAKRSRWSNASLYRYGEDRSFKPLDCRGDGNVSSHFFISLLRDSGLILDSDPRLQELHKALDARGAICQDQLLTLDELEACTITCRTLIRRCVAGQLCVPDFRGFSCGFEEVFREVEPNKAGANADYIPQLSAVNPEQFGIAVCTVDGQRFSVGDSTTQFCIQSCSKPIQYLLALRGLGQSYVHHHVGHEPSGQRFNQMVLKDAPTAEYPERQIPHNPLINAGAILCTSMVAPDADIDARLQFIMETWRELSGFPVDGGLGCPIGYDEATYASESKTADRNWCLGYMMKDKKSFPPCFTKLSDTLELYFKTCSILSTAEGMAAAAATLANGGLCPLTSKRIFTPDSVRDVLPIMLTCGMYDYSGEWAYHVGLPSKSGVAGCVFMVVPNVCGIAVWSPRLDEIGNSVRGIAAAKALVQRFALHNFEVFSGMAHKKINPLRPRHAAQQRALGEVLFAASVGDVSALEAMQRAGIDLYAKDYDRRTAMHLAAAEGMAAVLSFLIDNAPPELLQTILASRDRWGGTPLDDAIRGSHGNCEDVLRAANAPCGQIVCYRTLATNASRECTKPRVEGDVPIALFAVADGDLVELIRINATGRCSNLFAGDYDMRTALHLAASEGHIKIVEYLLAQAPLSMRNRLLATIDRFGATPYDDAMREGHTGCAELLRVS